MSGYSLSATESSIFFVGQVFKKNHMFLFCLEQGMLFLMHTHARVHTHTGPLFTSWPLRGECGVTGPSVQLDWRMPPRHWWSPPLLPLPASLLISFFLVILSSLCFVVPVWIISGDRPLWVLISSLESLLLEPRHIYKVSIFYLSLPFSLSVVSRSPLALYIQSKVWTHRLIARFFW
jgi:hypothetical protein